MSDPERCRQAGIPAERTFAIKPALAIQMLQRSFAAGVRLTWITGDDVYGDNHPLREWRKQLIWETICAGFTLERKGFQLAH
jgi:SRSO17 transposase